MFARGNDIGRTYSAGMVKNYIWKTWRALWRKWREAKTTGGTLTQAKNADQTDASLVRIKRGTNL